MVQARLMANARENTILCDDNTRRRSTTEVQPHIAPPWLCPRVQQRSAGFSIASNGRGIASLCQIIYNALAPIYVKGKVPGGKGA